MEKKLILSCESYYWLVYKSKAGKEAFKDKAVGVLKGSIVVPFFYVLGYFIFVMRDIGIPQWGYGIIWFLGVLNVLMIVLSLVNLISSKRKTEGIGERNIVFIFALIILGLINFVFFAYLWFYRECWNTDVQYIGMVICLIGLAYITFQCFKIKIRLVNGYYKKGREKPPESSFKKRTILLMISLIPMLLAKGSRKGPFIRDLIGEEYMATFFLYMSMLLSAVLAELLIVMYYYIKWNYKYSKEERENLLAD